MKRKSVILKRIAKNLAHFHPEHPDCFMCPTSLSIIPLRQSEKISEAHITPKFSEGTLKTFLCTSCNSKFGSHQDKWLGEYIRPSKSGKTILSTTKQTGRFSVNDIPVSGLASPRFLVH